MRQGGMLMPPLCSTSRTLGLTPWILMGIVAIFIPIIIWNTQSQEYYREYGMMRQYEEEYYQQQKEGNDENNDNYYIYKECSFFNIACKKNQYYYATAEERQRANEDGNVLQTYQDLFILFGGYEQTEALQKWKAENASGSQDFICDGRSSGIKLVYEYPTRGIDSKPLVKVPFTPKKGMIVLNSIESVWISTGCLRACSFALRRVL